MNDQHHGAGPIPDKAEIRWEPDDLDGHSLDDLSDYLDAGCTPANASIDASPSCQIALASLARLAQVSGTLLDAQAIKESEPDEAWIEGILQNIRREARAGRSIPIRHPDPTAELAITEGSVRGLIRAAGDTITGLLVGRCILDGDVKTQGAPITIKVDASVGWGTSIPDAADRLRETIHVMLSRHTDINIAGIDVTVTDVHPMALKDDSQ